MTPSSVAFAVAAKLPAATESRAASFIIACGDLWKLLALVGSDIVLEEGSASACVWAPCLSWLVSFKRGGEPTHLTSPGRLQRLGTPLMRRESASYMHCRLVSCHPTVMYQEYSSRNSLAQSNNRVGERRAHSFVGDKVTLCSVPFHRQCVK